MSIGHILDPIDLQIEDDADKARRYRDRLCAHPRCEDPEHPGCAQCEPEGNDGEEDSE